MNEDVITGNKSAWWWVLRGIALLMFLTISCCGCLLFIGFTSDAEPRTVRATIGFSESSEPNTPTIDISPTSSSTPIPQKTLYSTHTPSPTPSLTPSRTPSITPSLTPTRTPSRTPTRTPSMTPSRTATFTKEPTPYSTQTATRVSVPTVPTVQQTQTPTLQNTCQGGCIYETEGCSIKGNVNSEGEKIYHYPNGQYYNRTIVNLDEGDRWFCTGAEAEANGFRASSR